MVDVAHAVDEDILSTASVYVADSISSTDGAGW